jgi:lycopene beta-cyclase
MPSGLDADIVIAGAGCAGLSLAVHLDLAGANDLGVLLLDPRDAHVNDRTWCYWALLDHPFEAAARQAWFRWKVVTGAGVAESGSPSMPYRCLPSGSFYELALHRLAARPNVQLHRGITIDGFRDEGDAVVAITSEGELRCRLAFDSRPRPREGGAGSRDVDWVQHFVGLEVVTEHPVFDPTVATLMDFRAMGDEGIRFMYVLPFDERRALVEDTFFGGRPLPEAAYLSSIRTYLGERLGATSWSEERREAGAIPMSTASPPAPPSVRVANIGTRAGLARPSTGYAFLAIQRHSQAVARHVAREGAERPLPAHRPYGRGTALLDRVFLAYLEREPAAAPEMFRRMFAGVEPERMARFLFDGGSARDRIAVMRVLPATPLIRQTLRDLGPAVRNAARRR